MRKGRVNLTEGPVGRHMVGLGVFLALGAIANMLTALADVYFVAQLGHHELAALSFTFPIQIMVGTLSMGLGNGIIAVIARAVGQNDHDAVQKVATDSIVLSMLIMMFLAPVGYATIDPLFTLMGATSEVLPYIKQYLLIWYVCAFVQLVPIAAQNIIRAHGDTRTPALITTAMCALNIVLDPILIFGWGPFPALGIEGAAYASVAARLWQTCVILYILHFRMRAMAPISFAAARLRDSWGKILHIGLPSATTQLVMPVSQAILTKIIALSGITAVAAYGVGTRIEYLAAIYLWGIAGAMPAFVGQNAGAGRMDRVQIATSFAIKACIGIGAGIAAVTMLAAPYVVAQFSDEAQVQALAAFYLRVGLVGSIVGGMVMVASQTLSALHHPMTAALINLARAVVVTVPLALLGHWLGQVHGVFIGISASSLLCGVGAWIVMSSVVKRETQRAATS